MKGFKFEPQTTAEVVRAGLLMLIGFKVFQWDESQQILVFAFLSMLLTWITRSFSIPVQTIVDAGTSVKKLESAAETRAAVAAGEKPPIAPGALSVVLLLLIGGAAFVPACGGNDKPNLSPAGQVADRATSVLNAADIALTGVEALTPTVLSRETTIEIAKVFKKIGHESRTTLADALEAYKKNVTPESWRSLQSALVALNGLVADGIGLAPAGPARDRVKLIAEPIFAALFAITLPPPPTGATPSDQASFENWRSQQLQFERQQNATAVQSTR